MTWTVQTLNGWSQTWTVVVWAAVWQSTLVAAAMALVCLALRRSSPALRYWLWQIVAVKMLLMPFWTVALPLSLLMGLTEGSTAVRPAARRTDVRAAQRLFDQQAHSTSGPQAKSGLPPAAWVEQITWQSWLLLGWAAMVAWYVARILVQHRRLARLLRQGDPAGAELTALVSESAARLNLRRAVECLVVEADCSPLVCGVRRPKLVLPRSLARSLGEARLRQVLLHELAHVRRWDLLWCWTAELVRIVYFFHPVAYWVRYRIQLNQELACDQVTMATSGETAGEYAGTLVEVVSHTSQPAAIKAAGTMSAGLDGNHGHTESQTHDDERENL